MALSVAEGPGVVLTAESGAVIGVVDVGIAVAVALASSEVEEVIELLCASFAVRFVLAPILAMKRS